MRVSYRPLPLHKQRMNAIIYLYLCDLKIVHISSGDVELAR